MAKNTPQLISEINHALDNLNWGSVEIYVQNDVVTQITVKNIKKTSVSSKTERILSQNSNGNKKPLTNRNQNNINDITT